MFDSKVREWSNVPRLIWASDDFFGVVVYRLRVSLHDRGVPIVPQLLHLFCRAAFRINIANEAVIDKGLYLLHGNVTIKGRTRIGANVSIAPWVSIGIGESRSQGPVIGDSVFIGTGSTIRGAVVIGERATIGARTLVSSDVPPGVTFVGEGTGTRQSTSTPRPQDLASSSDERRRVQAAAKRHERHRPPLSFALRADGVAFANHISKHRAFPSRAGEWRNVLILLLSSPSFAALAMYRLRSKLRALRIPVAASLTNKLTIALFNVRIGDTVRVAPGVCIPQGDVVIDGITSIDGGCIIGPSTTIGLQQGAFLGPRLQSDVKVGANAAILGDIRVGRGAHIHPGSVVVRDVPDHTAAVGVPARVAGSANADSSAGGESKS